MSFPTPDLWAISGDVTDRIHNYSITLEGTSEVVPHHGRSAWHCLDSDDRVFIDGIPTPIRAENWTTAIYLTTPGDTLENICGHRGKCASCELACVGIPINTIKITNGEFVLWRDEVRKPYTQPKSFDDDVLVVVNDIDTLSYYRNGQLICQNECNVSQSSITFPISFYLFGEFANPNTYIYSTMSWIKTLTPEEVVTITAERMMDV
jgi:hypothetical protein